MRVDMSSRGEMTEGIGPCAYRQGGEGGFGEGKIRLPVRAVADRVRLTTFWGNWGNARWCTAIAKAQNAVFLLVAPFNPYLATQSCSFTVITSKVRGARRSHRSFRTLLSAAFRI